MVLSDHKKELLFLSFELILLSEACNSYGVVATADRTVGIDLATFRADKGTAPSFFFQHLESGNWQFCLAKYLRCRIELQEHIRCEPEHALDSNYIIRSENNIYVVAAPVETGYPGVTAEIERAVLLKADRLYHSSRLTHFEGITDLFFNVFKCHFYFIPLCVFWLMPNELPVVAYN